MAFGSAWKARMFSTKRRATAGGSSIGLGGMFLGIAIKAAERESCPPVLIVAQHVSVSLEPRAAARTSALYKPSKSRRSEGRAAF